MNSDTAAAARRLAAAAQGQAGGAAAEAPSVTPAVKRAAAPDISSDLQR